MAELIKKINSADAIYRMYNNGEVTWLEAMEHLVNLGCYNVTKTMYYISGNRLLVR